MRSKRALLNTIINILNEIIVIISTFILPRLIITTFGSDYNGLISSITQFVSWIALLQGLCWATTKAALYKPLAEKNTEAISAVVLATQVFMKKIALVFSFALIVLALLFPFISKGDYGWLFSASLVFIIGIGTAIQCSVGVTYRALVTADQKQYLVSGINIIAVILNTIFSIFIIRLGAGIHVVKLVNSLFFIIGPIFLYFYSKKHYNLNFNIKPDNSALKQRWNALAHHLASFFRDNSDVVIITLTLNLIEVSVYAVYYLVIRGLQSFFNSLITGFDSFFGDMLAKEEHDIFKNNFSIYEFISFSVATFIFSITYLQITPFISIYTKGIVDADYFRPIFGYIACFATYFRCICLPYSSVTFAAGHFKQTQNGAITEAVIKVVISLILVFFFGITGVVIGTLLSGAFRAFQYAFYLYKNIIKKVLFLFVKRALISLFSMIIIIIISQSLSLNNSVSYYTWIINSLIYSAIAFIITFLINSIFYKHEMMMLYKKIINIFKKEKHKT